jgi:hypothetical protein
VGPQQCPKPVAQPIRVAAKVCIVAALQLQVRLALHSSARARRCGSDERVPHWRGRTHPLDRSCSHQRKIRARAPSPAHAGSRSAPRIASTAAAAAAAATPRPRQADRPPTSPGARAPKRPVCAVQPHRWPLVSGRSPSPRHPPPGRSDHSSRCRHQERCLRPLRPPAVPWSSGRQRPTRIHATRAVLGMLLSRDRGPPVALGGNTPRIINDTGTPSCRARRPDDQADRLRSPRQKVTGYER